MSGILVSLMGFYFVQMGMILDELSTPIAVIAILPSAHRVEPLQGVYLLLIELSLFKEWISLILLPIFSLSFVIAGTLRL
jgi:hypothetical protein